MVSHGYQRGLECVVSGLVEVTKLGNHIIDESVPRIGFGSWYVENGHFSYHTFLLLELFHSSKAFLKLNCDSFSHGKICKGAQRAVGW
jgi:hypothetical protein